MKLPRLLLILLCSITLFACESANHQKIKVSDDSHMNILINATIKLAKESTYFENRILLLSLYEYDPMLADTPASLIESKKIAVSYMNRNKPLSILTSLGNGNLKRAHHKYYLVAEIQDKDEVRTHYGYKNGTEGFIKVLEESNEVIIILRSITQQGR